MPWFTCVDPVTDVNSVDPVKAKKFRKVHFVIGANSTSLELNDKNENLELGTNKSSPTVSFS